MKTTTDSASHVEIGDGNSAPNGSPAGPASGAETKHLSTASLLTEVESLRNDVVTWRRHLHMHPELSFHEHETSNYVYNALSEMPGLELSRPTATSVLARLRGPQPGKVIGVRADMDALPITEENDVPYKSRVEGSMHACGHDGHTSVLLGLAKLLSARRDELRGEVRFIFQHAEELSPGGAQELVDVGVMDGVDEVIGIHLWAFMSVGKIAIVPGPAMASPDTFECTIVGKGGHAAYPHQTVDPIVIASQVVTALQHIVARGVDPLERAVVSVTQFQAGTTYNVIPSTAYLAGTVRTFDAALRDDIPKQMERIISGVTSAFGATYKLSFERGYRPVVNDPALSARLAAAVDRHLGAELMESSPPSMGGEDFSAYQQRAPGVFAFIGAGNKSQGIEFPHHHPRFQVDEESLHIALRYLTVATLECLA